MKKYILVLSLCLLTTGCFGSSGKGILKTTCQKEENTYGFNEKETFTFEYYKGSVNKVILKTEYDGEDMNKYIETYKNSYSSYTGVTVETENNKVTLTLDVTSLSDDIKKTFDVKDTYNEQTKVLEEKGYKCN